MYDTLKIEMTGLSPLILHNGHLADPANAFSVAIKKISSKRKKTTEDYIEMARLEFHGSLYLNADGRIIIPGDNIEAMFINAAKKHKLGPLAKAGIFCEGDSVLQYSGPKKADALWEAGNHADKRGVVISRARVMRTRPIFHDWALAVKISYMPDIIDDESIRTIVNTAGLMIGLGDYRPKYGRFESTVS